MNGNRNDRINMILYLSCLVARIDYDIARDSNRLDQLNIIYEAKALALPTIASTVAWSAFWCSFLSPWIGCPLGILMGLFTLLMDSAMSASNWEVNGILKPPAEELGDRKRKEWWKKLLVRLTISLILSQATSTTAVLWIFHGTIDNQIRKKNAEVNSSVEREYDGLKNELKSRLVAPLEKELAMFSEESKALIQTISDNKGRRSEAFKRASTARIEAQREFDGGLKNYYKGDGPLYREALRQEREADQIGETLKAEIEADEARLTLINGQIEAKRRVILAMHEKYNAECLDIDKRKVSDSRWMIKSEDPLSRYIGLQELKKDPEYGFSVWSMTFLMNAVIVTFELSFLIIKTFFSPPSVYHVRLIARTKLEAARVAAQYARARNEPRRVGRPRKLTIKAGYGEADELSRNREPVQSHARNNGDEPS